MKSSKMNWPELAVEEFAEVVTGGTPSTLKPEYWEGGSIPWLNSGELNKRVITEADNFITEAGLTNSAAKMMPEDTVLIALTGATTGVSALLKMRACGNQSVTGILPSDRHHPHFLFHYLQSIRPKIITESYGGAQKHISQGYVKKLKVPLPPVEEQERIAKLLDEADELRKLRVQSDRRVAALIPALFHEMFGDPKHSWRSSALGELVQDFRYGTSNKSTGEGKPTLRIPNVIQEAVNLDDLKFVPVSDSEFERLRLKDGDLLFVRTNGNADNVGRCAVFNAQAVKTAGHNSEDFIYASYLIRARLQAGQVIPFFVQHFLASPDGCSALRARSKTSAGQFNINTEGLGTIPIPVPPLALQREFAEWVTKIRAVQADQSASRKRLDDLFQSMLHRAFEGEL